MIKGLKKGSHFTKKCNINKIFYPLEELHAKEICPHILSIVELDND
jgi:hypothetical protein